MPTNDRTDDQTEHGGGRVTAATAPRGIGRPGRLEVWYATFSEPDGSGWWLHLERLAPPDGAAVLHPAAGAGAIVHGWAAHFPLDAAPVVDRIPPVPAGPDGRGDASPDDADALLASGHNVVAPGRWVGSTPNLGWNLAVDTAASPLFTFPRWSWEREVLPGAQIVDVPDATVRGHVRVGETGRDIRAHGAQAHIFSHGNAVGWTWIHADLGNGDVCELVAAVPHAPGGLHVPPLPVLRLRVDGYDAPRDPVLAALGGAADVDLPRTRAVVPLGLDRRVRVRAELEPRRCVQLEYPNPDGSRVFCTNTERADVRVVIERRRGRNWQVEREWDLRGTGHAEVGRGTAWDAVAVCGFA